MNSVRVECALEVLCKHDLGIPWSTDMTANSALQEVSALLGCLGRHLTSLSLEHFDQLFAPSSFWVVSNLTALSLTEWSSRIQADEFDRGMRHLRQDATVNTWIGVPGLASFYLQS